MACAIGLFGAPSAFASTVDVQSGTLIYTGGSLDGTNPENNIVQIDFQQGGYHINESGDGGNDTITPVASYTAQCAGGGSDVVCKDSGIKAIKVDVGDGSDKVTITGSVTVPATIYGGPGGDELNGSQQADTIDGGDGNDNISGIGGDDTLIGGAGNDYIRGGDGNDSIDGGPGNDPVLDGGDGSDTIIGGDGNDADIEGGEGNDTIMPGLGTDGASGGIHGGPGRDTVSYADHPNAVNIDINNNPDDGEPNENDDVRDDVEVVIGGPGDDRIAGNDNANTLIGGGGNDTLLGRGGDDTLDGGAGDDVLDGGAGADSLTGGDGSDSVTYAGRTAGVSITLDGAANDGEAGEGDNVSSDIEQLYGGQGDDTLIGNDDRNFISGLGGTDHIEGRGGDDVINGGDGADYLSGGDGSDIVDYYFNPGPISVSYDGQPNDGTPGEGDNLQPDIEGVIGSNGDDRYLGGPGNDFIYAFAGNDSIFGGPGSDMIVAGDGDDHIDSVDGVSDFVSCGDGNDSVIADPADSVAGDCETKVIGPAVLVTTQAVVRLAGGAIGVPLTCQRLVLDGCSGTVQLQANVVVQPKRKAKAKSKKAKPKSKKAKPKSKAKPKTKLVTLGSVPYSLAPGQTLVFTVPLPRTAQALVTKTGITVTAVVTNTDSAGSTTTSQGQFVVKPLTPPKKKSAAGRKPSASK